MLRLFLHFHLMKPILVSVILFLCYYNTAAQPFFLLQDRESDLYIYNASSLQKNQIAKNVSGLLSGYYISGDTLVCYMNEFGKWKKYNVILPQFTENLPELPVTEEDEFKKQFITKDSILLYQRGDDGYQLILVNNSDIRLYKNQKRIWEYNNPNHNYIAPSFIEYTPSDNGQYLCVNIYANNKAAEERGDQHMLVINTQTGNAYDLGSGKQPHFSPGGHYLLSYDNTMSTIYHYDFTSLQVDKRTRHPSSNIFTIKGHAFWLHK